MYLNIGTHLLTGCPKRPPPACDVGVAPKPPNPPADAAGAPKAAPAGLAPKSPPPVAAVVGAPKVLVVCPNGALETAGAPKAPPPPPNSGLFCKDKIKGIHFGCLLWGLTRLVNDHRLNLLIDSKILADLRIMVNRLQNHYRGFKMTHIEAKFG